MTLELLDKTGIFEKSNCKWSTTSELVEKQKKLGTKKNTENGIYGCI